VGRKSKRNRKGKNGGSGEEERISGEVRLAGGRSLVWRENKRTRQQQRCFFSLLTEKVKGKGC